MLCKLIVVLLASLEHAWIEFNRSISNKENLALMKKNPFYSMDTEKLRIRPVRQTDDAAACAAVYADCIAKRPDLKGVQSSYAEALIDPEQQKEWQERGYPVLVATIDDEPVGLACLQPRNDWQECFFNAEVVVIVKPSLHRQAIAKRLWLALLADDAVARKGVHVIYASVAGTNVAAISACIRAGFRQTGNMTQVYCSGSSSQLYDQLYFEKLLGPRPDVSQLGWSSPDGRLKAKFEPILSSLSSEDLDYAYITASDGSDIQDISDYIAGTELFPIRASPYPAGYGQRVVERMKVSQSPTVILRDKRTKTVVGWSNFLRWGFFLTSESCVMDALFTINLPKCLMKPEVISRIWSLLLRANEALGDASVPRVHTFSACDDTNRRVVLEHIIKMRKAYTNSSEFIKFGRLHDTITCELELIRSTSDQRRRFKEELHKQQKRHDVKGDPSRIRALLSESSKGQQKTVIQPDTWRHWMQRKLGGAETVRPGMQGSRS